jgi:uncharacterized membrane protein HdeD (DUF308 family)
MIIVLAGDWKTFALGGTAACLFGVLTLVWPGLTLAALVLLFGAFVLVHGGPRTEPSSPRSSA